MDLKERMARALETLGPNVRIVSRKHGKKKKKPGRSAVFMPKSKKRHRDMDRSEYSQCGKKIRYKTHADAVAAKQACEKARGKKLRIYRCEICSGFHLTSSFRFNEDTR